MVNAKVILRMEHFRRDIGVEDFFVQGCFDQSCSSTTLIKRLFGRSRTSVMLDLRTLIDGCRGGFADGDVRVDMEGTEWVLRGYRMSAVKVVPFCKSPAEGKVNRLAEQWSDWKSEEGENGTGWSCSARIIETPSDKDIGYARGYGEGIVVAFPLQLSHVDVDGEGPLDRARHVMHSDRGGGCRDVIVEFVRVNAQRVKNARLTEMGDVTLEIHPGEQALNVADSTHEVCRTAEASDPTILECAKERGTSENGESGHRILELGGRVGCE